MTALEICNYLRRCYRGEYNIVMNGSPAGLVFLNAKPAIATLVIAHSTFLAQTERRVMILLDLLQKNNLENYLVSSLRHLSRSITPFDIDIDNSGKVVIFE